MAIASVPDVLSFLKKSEGFPPHPLPLLKHLTLVAIQHRCNIIGVSR
jgi:hypothetical protein